MPERQDIEVIYQTVIPQREDVEGKDMIVLVDLFGNPIAQVSVDDIFDMDGNRFYN